MSGRDAVTTRRPGRRWRVLGALSLAGAVASLGAGVAFAYFSTTATGTGDANVGHLHVTAVVSGTASVSHTCTVTGMTPGESSTGWATGGKTDTPCTFTVALTATGPAYLGLSIATAGGLYVAGTSHSLRFAVADTKGNLYSATGTLNPNSPTDPLYVGTFPPSTGTRTFTVNFSLPPTAPATLSSQTTTLTLTVHAVSTGVGAATGCSPGTTCSGITRWS